MNLKTFLLTVFMGVLIGYILLHLEYDFFIPRSESPPSISDTPPLVTESTSKTTYFITYAQAADCTKKRLVTDTLVDDCKTEAPKTISLKVSYLYRDGGTGAFKHFGNGSVLHSGDSIKLIFTPSEDDVYIYIFMTDSHNNVARLFPTDDFKGAASSNKNPIKKGQQYFIPSASKSFQLDNNIGEESIYLIASRQADAVLENQYKAMLSAQQANEITNITVIQTELFIEIEKKTNKQRLITPELVEDTTEKTAPVNFTEKGQSFTVLPQYLKNMCEGCVYKLSFQHR
jgi:hypothetical protein